MALFRCWNYRYFEIFMFLMLNTQSNLIKKDKLNVIIEEAPPPIRTTQAEAYVELKSVSETAPTSVGAFNMLCIKITPGGDNSPHLPWKQHTSPEAMMHGGITGPSQMTWLCPHGQIQTLPIPQTPASLFPRSTKLLPQEERESGDVRGQTSSCSY